MRAIAHPSDRRKHFDNQNREDPVRSASQDANRVAPTQRRKTEHLFVDGDPPLSAETTDQDRLFGLGSATKGCENNGYRRTIVRGKLNEALWRA